MNRRHITAIAALALAGTIGLTGCGSDAPPEGTSAGPTPSGSAPSVSQDADIATLVPSDIRERGTITVATEAQYPPFEYFDTDNTTIIGFDADLAQALGQAMGLKVTMKNAGFDTIIPGLQGGKYDLGISSFTDTKEREQVVDFVTYLTEGTILMTKSGNPDGLDISDLCGHTIGVGKGGTEATLIIPKLNQECEANGEDPIDVKVFSGQDAPNLALASGQIQGTILDQIAAAQIAAGSNGKFQVAGEAIESSPIGVAVPKESGMTEAVHAALQSIIDDGTYGALVERWNLGKGAVTSSEVNVAKS
jgi:polar amino acid transport system substrate-binding protein